MATNVWITISETILAEMAGEDYLRQVIEQAEPGTFSEKSWVYWHYRLRLAELEQVPPLPRRKFD